MSAALPGCDSHSAVSTWLRVLAAEAVPEPGCVCADGPKLLTKREEGAKCVCNLTEVLHDAVCLCKAVCGVNALHSWELSAYDPHRCFQHPPLCFIFLCFVKLQYQDAIYLVIVGSVVYF